MLVRTWPKRSLTRLTGTPCAMSVDEWVCLSPCMPMCGTFAWIIHFTHFIEYFGVSAKAAPEMFRRRKERTMLSL